MMITSSNPTNQLRWSHLYWCWVHQMRLDSWRRTTHEMDVRPSSKLNINTSLYFSGVFSLFSIVQFPNLRCTSSTSSTTYGTCLTRLCPHIHYCCTHLYSTVWQGSFIHSLVNFIIIMIIHSSECSTNGGSSDGNCAAGFGNSIVL